MVTALFVGPLMVCLVAPIAGAAAGYRPVTGRAALRPAVAFTLLLLGSAVLLRNVSGATLRWQDLLAAHVTLGAAALALAMVGVLASATFRDVLDGAGVSMSVGAIAGLGILLIGPPAADIPTPALNAVLLASPIVATAAAANIDLLRTPTLYRLSPIAHTRFDYPEWYVATAAYLLTAAAAGTTTFYLRQRRG